MPISRKQSFVRKLLTNLSLNAAPRFPRGTSNREERQTNCGQTKRSGSHGTQVGYNEGKKGTILSFSDVQLRLLRLMQSGSQPELKKGPDRRERRKEKPFTQVVRSHTLPARKVVMLRDTKSPGKENNTTFQNRFQRHISDVTHTSSIQFHMDNSKRGSAIRLCECENRVTVNGHCFDCDHLNIK